MNFIKQLKFWLKLKLKPIDKRLKVGLLRFYSDLLKVMINKVDYRQGILVNKSGIYALTDGILLDTIGTNRYFKANECEGKTLLDFLKDKGIEVKTMVDLGANFGEISLYFSKQNQNAKILAVEGSPENFKILASNCARQLFSTNNIILLNEAVNDRAGVVKITQGLNSENTIINNGENIIDVKSDTLESILERFGIERIDFLKIDIEGSEHLLYNSLKNIINNIKSVHLETTNQELIKLFNDNNFYCHKTSDNEMWFINNLK